MYGNHLSTLNAYLFEENDKLTAIGLDQNRFTVLDPNMFEHLKLTLNKLNLLDNLCINVYYSRKLKNWEKIVDNLRNCTVENTLESNLINLENKLKICEKSFADENCEFKNSKLKTEFLEMKVNCQKVDEKSLKLEDDCKHFHFT